MNFSLLGEALNPSSGKSTSTIRRSIGTVSNVSNNSSSNEENNNNLAFRLITDQDEKKGETTYTSLNSEKQMINRIWTAMNGSGSSSRLAPGGSSGGSGGGSSSIPSYGVPDIAGDTGLFGNTASRKKGLPASSNTSNEIRERYGDNRGDRKPEEEIGGKRFDSPKDGYKARELPDEKPPGTGEEILDYKSMLTDKDRALFDKLSQYVTVFRDDRVGFDCGSLTDSEWDKSGKLASEKEKNEALTAMVDAIKNDPRAHEYIDKLRERGGMSLFLSDKLAYGLNKSVGGYVQSGEHKSKIGMAVPNNITDWTHTDIFRHEMMHVLDRLADDQLDGLMLGESKEIQNLMVTALEKFQATKLNKEAVEKLDVGNLRYGAGYLKYKNNPEKQMFTWTEARAVLEQEWSDKPEEFKAVGEEFAQLAEYFEKRGTKYSDSYVQKDGIKEGKAMK
jgi:hypothetical protein